MNFIVEHVGKVCKADIILDGITIIAGPNGSGKSTISRVLMTLCSVLRRWTSRVIDEKLKSAREVVNNILESHNLPGVSHLLLENDSDLVRFMKLESWNDSKLIEERLQSDVEYIISDDRNAHTDAEMIFAVKEEIIEALRKVQDRGSSYYLPSIFTDSFVTALHKGFASAWSKQGRCSVRLGIDGNVDAGVCFRDDSVDECKTVSPEKIPFVFYFEPVNLLDCYASYFLPRGIFKLRLSATARYNAPDVDWGEFLFKDVDKSEWSVERKQKQEEIEKTLDELLAVMRGHLEKQERVLFFVDTDVSIPVPVMNVASGIKTMSVIEKGIRTGVIQPGCLLMIDEPESNLHPQWQIEFAHFLVKLQSRFNMRLLLNTHSPFFLKAIEVFSREEGCGPRTHFYHMEKDAVEAGYVAKELKDGTNEIFKTYFDAMNDLLSR